MHTTHINYIHIKHIYYPHISTHMPAYTYKNVLKENKIPEIKKSIILKYNVFIFVALKPCREKN